MEKFKNFLHIVFEKYGWIKFWGSFILSLLFFMIYEKTGDVLWKGLAIPFAVYSALIAIILFIFAWFINPFDNE